MAHVHAARRSSDNLLRCCRQGGGFSSVFFGYKDISIFSSSSKFNGRISTANFVGNGAKESSTAAQVEGDIPPSPEVGTKVVEETQTPSPNVNRKQLSIPFEEFVKVKRKMRARQRVAGIPFALVGLGTSSVVSAYMFPDMFDATPDNVQLILGMDPLIFCGICGVVSCGIGYVAGSSLFGVFNRLLNKDLAKKIDEREQDFLQRIQSHRFADFSKFEDDYYGESIKTLSDYRQWLRTQERKKTAAAKFIKDKQQQPS